MTRSSRLDRLIEERTEASGAPGLALAVVADGRMETDSVVIVAGPATVSHPSEVRGGVQRPRSPVSAPPSTDRPEQPERGLSRRGFLRRAGLAGGTVLVLSAGGVTYPHRVIPNGITFAIVAMCA